MSPSIGRTHAQAHWSSSATERPGSAGHGGTPCRWGCHAELSWTRHYCHLRAVSACSGVSEPRPACSTCGRTPRGVDWIFCAGCAAVLPVGGEVMRARARVPASRASRRRLRAFVRAAVDCPLRVCGTCRVGRTQASRTSHSSTWTARLSLPSQSSHCRTRVHACMHTAVRSSLRHRPARFRAPIQAARATAPPGPLHARRER